ncbi:MAG: hypothetical protein OEM97_04965 [Acidimicrobiia bacterium]|nr:hypothetical protein [Acidimicrobiia bacterium]
MTRILHYTLEQWDELLAAPWMAAAAIIDGDPSGPIGTGHETFSVRVAIKTAAATPTTRRQLVYRIAEELRDVYGLEPPPSMAEPKWPVALDHIRRSVAILDRTASAADAEEFRTWLWEIACGVAEAAREGFAGMGVRVSNAERAILDELRAELRLDA